MSYIANIVGYKFYFLDLAYHTEVKRPGPWDSYTEAPGPRPWASPTEAPGPRPWASPTEAQGPVVPGPLAGPVLTTCEN